MSGWMTRNEALAIDPKFFAARGDNSWSMNPERGEVRSRFGFGQIRVQKRSDGSPDFDRLVYGEAPNINCVVWGRDSDGIYKVGVVIQARPFADMPTGEPADTPIAFGQPCVMAFSLRNIVGEGISRAYESGDDTSVREALEEAGAVVIHPPLPMGYHNPNPTFVATWSQLFEIEVDLSKVTEPTDQTELIYRAEYISVKELLARIAEGEHQGVSYRSATANDAFFVWLAKHPEALE